MGLDTQQSRMSPLEDPRRREGGPRAARRANVGGQYASSSDDEDDEDARLAESARASARLGKKGPGLRTALRSSRPARVGRSPPRPRWGPLGTVRRVGEEKSAASPGSKAPRDTAAPSPAPPVRRLPLSAPKVESWDSAGRMPSPSEAGDSASHSSTGGDDSADEDVQGSVARMGSPTSSHGSAPEDEGKMMSSTPGTRAVLTGIARDHAPQDEAKAEAAVHVAAAATACDAWVAEAEEGLARVQEERLAKAVEAMRQRDAEIRVRLREQAWEARESYLCEVERLREAFARGAEAAFATMGKKVDAAIASAMETPPKGGRLDPALRPPPAVTTPPQSPRSRARRVNRIQSAPASPGREATKGGARKAPTVPSKPYPASAARSPRGRAPLMPSGSTSAGPTTPATGEKKLRRAARELLESDDD